MQLEPHGGDRKGIASICALLSTATCSLLAAMPVTATETAAAAEQPWRADIGTVHYAEKDRITVNGLTARLKRQVSEESSVSLRSTYDAVSGSSPTGAVKIQSRSGASGAAYLTSFSTKRTSVGADWDGQLDALTRFTMTADRSMQSTYESWGVGTTVARDFNQRNTTLVAGIGYSKDLAKPKGGIHYGLSSIADNKVRLQEDTKDQLDLQLGITQVLTSSTLVQLNFVHSRAEGYMTNPYKIISVVNAMTGSTGDYDAIHEKRPRTRNSNALYAQLNQHLGAGIAYVAYRHVSDDWGIRSHTVDVKYRHPLGERVYVQPHVRYYQQTAANFYRSMLTNAEMAAPPQYASADYRLAKLHTVSLGMKVGYRPRFGGELTLRAELIRQNGENRPWDAVGIQREAGVFPSLKASMVHVAYTLPF